MKPKVGESQPGFCNHLGVAGGAGGQQRVLPPELVRRSPRERHWILGICALAVAAGLESLAGGQTLLRCYLGHRSASRGDRSRGPGLSTNLSLQ